MNLPRFWLNIAEVCAAAGAFLLGSSFGLLGAFVAGLAYMHVWVAVEKWADGLA